MSTRRSKVTKSQVGSALPKCPTGIQGLDEITFGGLPAGRTTLVYGGAGCGLGEAGLLTGSARVTQEARDAAGAMLVKPEQIVVTPTLVRKLPLPVRKIIGDLSDNDRVLVGLDLIPSEVPLKPPGGDSGA